MIDNHKFKIGDHVMHMPTGMHTIWEISGYGENGYMVKEHLESVRILYEKEDEWDLNEMMNDPLANGQYGNKDNVNRYPEDELYKSSFSKSST